MGETTFIPTFSILWINRQSDRMIESPCMDYVLPLTHSLSQRMRQLLYDYHYVIIMIMWLWVTDTQSQLKFLGIPSHAVIPTVEPWQRVSDTDSDRPLLYTLQVTLRRVWLSHSLGHWLTLTITMTDSVTEWWVTESLRVSQWASESPTDPV